MSEKELEKRGFKFFKLLVNFNFNLLIVYPFSGSLLLF